MIRRKPRRDPVSPELRAAILERDGWCVLAKIDPEHQCRDIWGYPHHPADKSKLTIEHLKDSLRMGLRAPSDRAHLIALCGAANVGVPSKRDREAFRAYLARVEADPLTVMDGVS